MASGVLTFDWSDLLIIGLFFAGVLVVGFTSGRRKGNDLAEVLAAGRSLTLPVFVATLVSTWYGGILGIGEFSYTSGLSAWFLLGFPYYIFAIFYALFLAPRIRRGAALTIPETFEAAYGRPAAIAGAVLTFLLVNPAPYVLMLGLMSQMVFGGPLLLHLLLCTVLSGAFLYSGGLRSNVMTNVLEFVLMYVGFAIFAFYAIRTYGGPSFVLQNVPSENLTLMGPNSTQTVVVWFLIALWTFVDPSFHQRSTAAKDERTARNGILISVVFWFLFDIMTVGTGLYARAAIQDLPYPTLAYPALAERILPSGIKGFVMVGMLATVISTLTSYLMLAGGTVGSDIAARWTGKSGTAGWVRGGLVIASIAAVGLAWVIPSVVSLWYTIGSCFVPGLLLPVAGSYFPALRLRGSEVIITMIASTSISTASLLAGHLSAINGVPQYWFGVEPLLPGLGLSAVLWSFFRLRH